MTESGARTTFAYDAADQLTTRQAAAARTTFTYDGAGNLAVENAPGGRTTYAWDGESRLIKALLPGGTRATFLYDGDGRRVRLDDSSGTTQFVFDGRNVHAELDGTGALVAENTVEPAGYGNLMARRPAGLGSQWYTYDGLGSVDMFDGVLYDFGAYGDLRVATAPNTNAARFVGRHGVRYDFATGLYLMDARLYSPSLGRFASRDPLGFEVGDVNLYRYVVNNPVNRIDPSGTRLFAIDGTTNMPADVTNVWRFFLRYPGFAIQDKNYYPGPQQFFLARDSRDIYAHTYNDICDDICGELALRRPVCCRPVDLVGFSRGATIAATTARAIGNPGCDCSRYGLGWFRVPVRFIGLFDAVNLINVEIPGGWARAFSSNVRFAVHLTHTTRGPIPTEGGFVPIVEMFYPGGQPMNHVQVGHELVVLARMIGYARLAGVPIQ
jgi:RHS repeat-associated protein